MLEGEEGGEEEEEEEERAVAYINSFCGTGGNGPQADSPNWGP